MHGKYNFICFIAILVGFPLFAYEAIPYLSIRSQGINGAREIVGWENQINRSDAECNYVALALTPEFQQSFWPARISQMFFGSLLTRGTCSDACSRPCEDRYKNTACCRCPSLKIQGSRVHGRDSQALMAENFYLPSDFSSEITFEPRIQNFLVDFDFYVGLDSFCQGLYIRGHTPLCWTRWGLNYNEHVLDSGKNNYEPGFFNDTYSPADDSASPDVYGLPRDQMLGRFGDYVSHEGVIKPTDTVVCEPLKKARWSTCPRDEVRLAEITAALGWNFALCQDHCMGFNIRAAAPTGNRPEGKWLFEPIVGQGRHWELGAGFDAWWTWWVTENEDRSFKFYIDADVTHMFKARQIRTFDLKDKPLSRYMLAMAFTDNKQDLVARVGSRTMHAPNYQFSGEYVPVANISTIPVNVDAAAQGELILTWVYTCGSWQWDFGYNLWGRSCEKICPCTNKLGDYALKGNAYVYGFPAAAVTRDGLLTVRQPAIALSATQSDATITHGTNPRIDYATNVLENQNPGIDNSHPAYQESTNDILVTHGPSSLQGDQATWQAVGTSFEPVLLTFDDLDIAAGKQQALTNKIFTHWSYTWHDRCNWTPFLGFGAEVEFAQQNDCDDNCEQQCSSAFESEDVHCYSAALSQWGVWIKGGASF